MKILGFAGSNSLASINKQLVEYACDELKSRRSEVDIEILDLNDYEMSIYRPDRESLAGVPDEAKRFFDKISGADALIISLAEYNGNYTSAYKNIFDWASRIDMKVFQDKPTLLMGASPGPRGAGNVLKITREIAPFFGMDIKACISIASFNDHFDSELGKVVSEVHKNGIADGLSSLERAVEHG